MSKPAHFCCKTLQNRGTAANLCFPTRPDFPELMFLIGNGPNSLTRFHKKRRGIIAPPACLKFRYYIPIQKKALIQNPG